MDICKKIGESISKSLPLLGYGVVCVRISGKHKKLVEILIENLDGSTPSISDCQKASRHISPLMDVGGFMTSPYTLCVTSPGIDRPLVKQEDYVRFMGKKIALLVFDSTRVTSKKDGVLVQKSGVDEDLTRRRFLGTLVGFEQDVVSVQCNDDLFSIEFGNIQRAHLDGESLLPDNFQHKLHDLKKKTKTSPKNKKVKEDLR